MKLKSNKKKSSQEIKLLKLTKDLAEKKQELKIETALEKVRIKAMRMKKPDDMLDVCKTISLQLESLVANEIRNVQTAIFYKNRGTYMNYEYYAKHNKTVITETVYTNNKLHEEFAEKMLKGKGEFFKTHIKGKKVKDWITYQKTTNVFIDKYLETASSLNYYWFSLGPVALGISTYHPLNEEEIILFKRFLKVFELAYRRYLDIEKAVTQAREVQIQLALERVRARTMAMHRSEELSETTFVLFQQFVELGVVPNRFFIGTMNEEETMFDVWITEWGGEMSSQNFKVNIEEPLQWKKAFKAWKAHDRSLVVDINGEDLIKWNEYLEGIGLSVKNRKSVTRVVNTFAIFSNGFIAITTSESASTETVQLLERFADVFNLTYRRFLDLQKAEAQAREAQIEASLERVRAVAMSMHKSDDLLSICEVSFKEFKKLGFDNIRNALIHIQYDKQKYFMDYDFSDLTGGAITKIEYGSNTIVEDYLNKINSAKDAFFHRVIKGDQLKEWKDFRKNSGQKDDPRLDNATSLYYYFFSIGMGDIGISTLQPIDESQIKILKRFRNVFDLAYRRYTDIAQAEAQARESQIQLALERVRARTMAMHKSIELAETATVLFGQLIELGIEPNRLYICIMKDEIGNAEFWLTNEDGSKVCARFSANVNENLSFAKMFKGWIEKKESIVIDMRGKELQEYIQQLSKINVPFNESHSQKRRVQSIAYFSQGFIGIASPDLQPEETTNLLKRFATVFNLTYQRFLDLQKAEAQVKEARIEAALERVRAKTMAMHKSDELADTAAVVFQQLINLGIEPNRIYIAIIKDNKRGVVFWITNEDGSKVSSGFEANLNDNRSFQKMLDGWNEKKKSITIDMQGEELQEYFNHLTKLGVPFKGGLSQKRRLQYISYFSKGFIGVASPDETKPETLQLLERFAAVFNLTYTRFNDLLRAEAQNRIIQAENERKTKELEEARQLQLSLLPRELPKLPNLDIAVYMKTATEVGGDYYDFNVQENGVLDIGFGDATGHGLQAGTMITLMKGFFTSDAARFTPQIFLEHCNSMIRDIKLGRMLMSFSHLRFERKRLLISSAGMPPIYYNHKENNRTEEIMIQGLPLGALQNTSYNLVVKELKSGDTILLLTDGLPEQMNNRKVIFDYSRVLKYFDEIAENTSNEIMTKLVKKAEEWMDGQQQGDDITFVVIKVN